MKDNNLVMDVEALLAMAKPLISNHDCCIYRVPYDIREVNVKAYTPKFISIGPLHHNDQRLQIVEKYKQAYFKQFVARGKTKLEDLISSLEEVEPKLRQYYSENLKMRKDELVKVILVDACFIVELFYINYKNVWTDADTLLKPWLVNRIVPDLMLLENQVPFFILDKLYNLVFASDSDSASFLKLSIKYFSVYSIQEVEPPFEICHFTDLVRRFYLPQPMPGTTENYHRNIRTASEYHEAEVKFKINVKGLDLQFSGSCLKIPHILVADHTEVLFHNMVAFEQCHYPDKSYISDYVSVMDFLINTGKDVDILVKNKIILNWLGNNDDVAKLFNSLCKNVLVSNFNSKYVDVFNSLNAFCDSWSYTWWNKLRATLKRDYCNTPWRTIATVAAVAILLLTFIQTVCSIIQAV